MTQNNEDFLAADRKREFRPDEIGYWSELKLDIVKDYAAEYTKILTRHNEIKGFSYIDAFAGAGLHISKNTGEFVLGSPLNALAVRPKFSHYHYIDLDSVRLEELKSALGDRKDVTPRCGDSNLILLSEVFPLVRYDDYQRALCLLDPYGLHLSWDVIHAAGQMRSIEVFLNFPMMDMNMNVLWHRPELVDAKQAARMTRYWGDESWRNAAYKSAPDLFDAARVEKVDDANRAVADAFRHRLRDVAGLRMCLSPSRCETAREPLSTSSSSLHSDL